jgi:hypothetical protein
MAVIGNTPAPFAEFLAREMAKYARIIGAAGIQPPQ